MTSLRRLSAGSPLQIVLAGFAVTIVAVFAVTRLNVEADIYGLLGDDDPELLHFEAISEATPGLEELLVVCDADSPLPRDAVVRIATTDGIRAHTRSYYRAGRSSVDGFEMAVDPADWQETEPVLAAVANVLSRHSPDCGMTGTPAVVHEMQGRLSADLRVALLAATVLVGLLFAFAYRIRLLALAMLLPVLAGIVWGLAAYSFLREQLTLFAATVPTLLIGIGIDHCVHIIQSTRYLMSEGKLSQQDAALAAWKNLLGPITLASLTTAATFLSLTFARLDGLVDLGWAGTFVTLGVYAACITLLPAILILAPARWLHRSDVLSRPMRRLGPWLQARGNLLLVVFLAVGALSVAGVTRLEPMSDNRLLQSGDLPSLALQNRVAREHHLSSSPILLEFADASDAIELLAEPDRPDTVASLLSVPDVDTLVHVHPRNNAFERDNYLRIVDSLSQWTDTLGLGEYRLSGGPVLNERINGLVYGDVRVVIPLAAIGILLVLAVGTRSLLRPCLILLPLSLALVVLAGVMGHTGIAASVVTVAIVPLVLGIGVDGGVHLLAAWERHDGNVVSILSETGLAIVVTVATSIAAFAAFVLSKSPSLVHFGAQAAIALIGCLVVTLVVLPYLFRVLLRHPAGTGKDAA